MLFFIVFYGLDWVATVPPTIALCREHYGDDSAIVFGWVLASHQVGAAVVAFLGRRGPGRLRLVRRGLVRVGRAVRGGGADGAGDPAAAAGGRDGSPGLTLPLDLHVPPVDLHVPPARTGVPSPIASRAVLGSASRAE